MDIESLDGGIFFVQFQPEQPPNCFTGCQQPAWNVGLNFVNLNSSSIWLFETVLVPANQWFEAIANATLSLTDTKVAVHVFKTPAQCQIHELWLLSIHVPLVSTDFDIDMAVKHFQQISIIGYNPSIVNSLSVSAGWKQVSSSIFRVTIAYHASQRIQHRRSGLYLRLLWLNSIF